jgi:ergothioneine biosynthesis protein EgtB
MRRAVQSELLSPTRWSDRYRVVRQATRDLAAPLSAEDCCVQSMPDASPVKWHLAHTSWFFETFVLEPRERAFRPFDASFRVLFNSYYNGVGARHARAQRGLLTRPALERVLAYREDVDRRVLALLEQPHMTADLAQLLELGLQHEQQHQELLLTDVKHLFFCNPLRPAYGVSAAPAAATAQCWQEFAGGLVRIGHEGAGFCFDNELPRHAVWLEPYALAQRLVSNGDYLAFVQAGGYAEPGHWLAEGWDWRAAGARQHPLYWQPGERWQEFTLGGLLELDLQRPVQHVSYYEADAYARWAQARLPTEAEWEHGAGALAQAAGEVWQWTRSSYAPYPGFRAAPGAVGEYNGKFMVNQYVLRGGSAATPVGHVRPSYRNFFAASACWQFSGIRLARDRPVDPL